MSSVDRGRPFPDMQGEELVRWLLREIDEEEQLARAVGVDLTPPGPSRDHAPRFYAPLDVWLRRSEEIHSFREARQRVERAKGHDEHPRPAIRTDIA